MTPKSISVIINTYNRRQSLALTLHALTWLDYPLFEVIVVNGPSTDDTDAFLAAFPAAIKVGHCHNRNLSESRNIGVQMANGDIVVFIDDDAYPDPAWLTAIVSAYDHPEVAGAGGPVVGHTGHDYQAWYSLADRFGNAWTESPPAVNPTYLFGAPGSLTFNYTIGTNSSFLRDRLVSIGGFDEEFEYYLDEADVCCRIANSGFVVRSLEEGFVHHKFLPSTIRRDDKVVRDWYQILKSKFYFAMKHGLPASSFAEVCRQQGKYIELIRADVDHHFAAGAHDIESWDKFERDVVVASNHALALYVGGLCRERPRDWFDNSESVFLPFQTRQPAGQKLHVCFLSQEYPPVAVNGIGRVIHTLAIGLASLGHVVRVLTRGEDHDRVDFEDGVWVHRIVPREHPHPRKVKVPAHIWNHSASLLDELRRIDEIRHVDLVQSPNWDSEGIATVLDGHFRVMVGLYTPLKTVVRVDPGMREAVTTGGDFLPQLMKLEEYLYRHADGYLACGPAIVSEIESEYQVKLAPEKIGLVPHGLPDISVGVHRQSGDHIPRILFVGRLEARKGIDTLLDAATRLATGGAKFALVVIGDDTLPGPRGVTFRQEFEQASTDARDMVTFLGRVDDDILRQEYANCDIFVAPSRFESFGLMLVEAMIFEKPVVSADIGGMRKFVEHEKTGLLLPADDVDALTAALWRLLESEDLRVEMGRAGRRLYDQRFSALAMAQGVESFYQRMRERNATTKG